MKFPSVGDRQSRQISRRGLAEIIGPRVEEILELTLNELRRSGFPEEVLTSGIVLTGGASMLTGIVELAEEVFNLPARIGVPQEMGGVSERIRNHAIQQQLACFRRPMLPKRVSKPAELVRLP